jgi:hypothetical protein
MGNATINLNKNNMNFLVLSKRRKIQTACPCILQT